MKIILLTVFALIVSTILFSSHPSRAAGKLNVICGAEIDWCQLMADAFQKETGIDVSMVRKGTDEKLAQVRAESFDSQIDVWWGGTGDPHLQAAYEGLTLPYKPSNIDDLLGWATRMSSISGNRTIGIYAGALGFAYNTELLKEKGLTPPKCWKDLADPSYKGELQVPNPNSSGTAYTELATLVQLFGEDEAFRLLAAIGKNVSHYTKSGSEPTKAAARGETTLAIGFQHDMVKQAEQGFPLKIVSPCEGTGYEIGAVSIIKNARNLENAKKWVEFSLRPDVQGLAATVKSFQVPSNSKSTVPKEAPDLTSIKLIDYDFKTFGSPEMRKQLLTRWSAEIKK